MLLFAVISEPLAVIRGDDNQRGPSPSGVIQPLQKPPDLAVGERDLAAVRVLGKASRERRRRVVGSMGIEEVDPDEERARSRALEPFQGAVHHLATTPLAAVLPRGHAACGDERVVVDVEAAL